MRKFGNVKIWEFIYALSILVVSISCKSNKCSVYSHGNQHIAIKKNVFVKYVFIEDSIFDKYRVTHGTVETVNNSIIELNPQYSFPSIDSIIIGKSIKNHIVLFDKREIPITGSDYNLYVNNEHVKGTVGWIDDDYLIDTNVEQLVFQGPKHINQEVDVYLQFTKEEGFT